MTLDDEIEQAYASATTQSQEPEQDQVAVGEDTKTEPREPAEVITAPASYRQEYKDSFNTLPLEWQKYLASREKEVEQGLSRARNAYSWVDKPFNERKQALQAQGFNNAQEYYTALDNIAVALEKDPLNTIAQLQSAYGVNSSNENALQQQVVSLVAQQQEMQNQLQSIRDARIKSEWESFFNAKDEAGNPKHPYLDEVKGEMQVLLQAGIAKNYEDAYAKAVWQVEDVRNKLMEQKTKESLAKKQAETSKTKAAAFNPTSKSEGEPKELDLREEIARTYDNFNGEK